MTTYTLTADTNIDALAGRTGADVVNINGPIFTIDQDTRGCLGGTSTTSLGAVTISATLGGKIKIDATSVRWIPYTGGSGNVPAWNTVITQGGQSGGGKLIGVYASLTSASTATGAAMPATGFIKLKQVIGAYSAGALTGIGATASSADVAGWMEVVNEGTMTVPRSAEIEITGGWFVLGLTSGVADQTFQIPTNGATNRPIAGVFIETAVGSDDYRFWPNAGHLATVAGAEAFRGQVIWGTETGLVRIGNNGAAASGTAQGHTPSAGRKVVVPSVFMERCTSAARATNQLLPGSGLVLYGAATIRHAAFSPPMDFSNLRALTVDRCAVLQRLAVSNSAGVVSIVASGVGLPKTSSPNTNSLSISGVTALIFEDCVVASGGGHTTEAVGTGSAATIKNATGASIKRNLFRNGIAQTSSAFDLAVVLEGVANSVFEGNGSVSGAVRVLACGNLVIKDHVFCSRVAGLVDFSYFNSGMLISQGTVDTVVDNLRPAFAGVHFLLSQVAVGGTCRRVRVRNCGSFSSPVDMSGGTAAISAYASIGSASGDNRAQRIFLSSGASVSTWGAGVSVEDCGSSGYTGSFGSSVELKQRGVYTTAVLLPSVSASGTHFADTRASSTVGCIQFIMNAPAVGTSDMVTVSGGAAFTGTGLYMPTVGMVATWEMPYFARGHTALANTLPVMAGGTLANYAVSFDIDKNNGAGFSGTWTEASAANLAAATGIDPADGFKLRLKIETTATNTSVITNLYFTTDSSTSAAYHHPLDEAVLTLTNVVVGSTYRIEDTFDDSSVASGTAASSEIPISVASAGSSRTLRIKIRKATGSPNYKPFETQVDIFDTDQSVFILQQLDE